MSRARKLFITAAGLVLFTSLAAGIDYLYLVHGGRAAADRALAAAVEGCTIRCAPDDPCIFRSAAGEFKVTHGE